MTRRKIIHHGPVFLLCLSLGSLILFLACTAGNNNSSFNSQWQNSISRPWAGSEFWANRLQDWQVADGRLECREHRAAYPMRTLHLLTRQLKKEEGSFEISVQTGPLNKQTDLSENTWAGFLIGAGAGEMHDYSAALIHHQPGKNGGLICGINGQGKLVFRDMDRKDTPLVESTQDENVGIVWEDNPSVILRLKASLKGELYRLVFQAIDANSNDLLCQTIMENADPKWVAGNVALVSHPGTQNDQASYWFNDWKLTGSKVQIKESNALGPVISCMYTLHDDVLKLTAQFMPLSNNDTREASLEIRSEASESWQKIATASIIYPGYTGTFKVENWDAAEDWEYRIVYKLLQANGAAKIFEFEGNIRHDPVEKEIISMAGFTGNQNIQHPAHGVRTGYGTEKLNVGDDVYNLRWTRENVWYPHEDLVRHVSTHNPDILVFTGDQVYEHVPTKPVMDPNDNAHLDYLYKWYLFCSAFRDIMRDRPTICLPDDHDVYHGNLWGWNGRPGGTHVNEGGYLMPADWVNMVERTQTSHLPDPVDPGKIEQGIGVYFTAMHYGGVGMAILEDRKFKVPGYAHGYPEQVEKQLSQLKSKYGDGYAPRKKDMPDIHLLGERQLDFIRSWVSDWEDHYIKVAVSQTIFACAHTGKDGVLASHDRDANGWPQSGRNQALEELRKGFVFMLGGDQHLATVIHHGIDEFEDAGYSFCVPSIANFFVREWLPKTPGANRTEDSPAYTGQYLDGQGNRITMRAVANPVYLDQVTDKDKARERVELHRKAVGYGMVYLNKTDQRIKMECWPRYADPADPQAGPYPDWPITIRMTENYGREGIAWLPSLDISGTQEPVIKIYHEGTQELVYSIRIRGNQFQPKVFEKGKYDIQIEDVVTGSEQTIRGVNSSSGKESQAIQIELQ